MSAAAYVGIVFLPRPVPTFLRFAASRRKLDAVATILDCMEAEVMRGPEALILRQACFSILAQVRSSETLDVNEGVRLCATLDVTTPESKRRISEQR